MKAEEDKAKNLAGKLKNYGERDLSLEANNARILAGNIVLQGRSADQAKAPTIVIPPAPPVVPSGGDSNVSAVVNHNTNVVGSLAASTGAHGTIVANLGAM